MNILVIGNGFDLAHDLPTKYTDFLFFCSAIKCIIQDNGIGDKIPSNDIDYNKWLENNKEVLLSNVNIDKHSYIYNGHYWNYTVTERDKMKYSRMLDDFIKTKFLENDKDQKLFKEVIYLVFNNFWIDYFLQCDMHGKENWIDFESEISNVVKCIDNEMRGLCNNYSLYDNASDLPEDLLKFFHEQMYRNKLTYKIIRDKLEKDLNNLIRVFEIYLTEYIQKIDIASISPDIEEIETCSCIVNGVEQMLYSNVISFNYTNIYKKVYMKKKSIMNRERIDYIHGKAGINKTIESNNMVLGIDEYLDEEDRNKYVEFIAFKKFYQRIHKQTGCKYKEWVDDIRESWNREPEESKAEIRKCISKGDLNNRKIHRLYIFGHSLDVTDGDILKDLILNDNVHTTIFYHDKDAMGQQIANLVKIIHQDELIKRTGGSTKTIEFVPQKRMEPINEQEIN